MSNLFRPEALVKKPGDDAIIPDVSEWLEEEETTEAMLPPVDSSREVTLPDRS